MNGERIGVTLFLLEPTWNHCNMIVVMEMAKNEKEEGNDEAFAAQHDYCAGTSLMVIEAEEEIAAVGRVADFFFAAGEGERLARGRGGEDRS